MSDYWNEQKDFYFSEKQLQFMKVNKDQVTECRFKGEIYTEAIDAGKKPLSEWDDLRKIGTGSFSDCSFSK